MMVAIVTFILLFILMLIIQERRNSKWIEDHWFCQRTMASKLSIFLFILSIVFLSLSVLSYKLTTKYNNLIILMDISSSMQAQDVLPNRLSFAKLLARKIIRKVNNQCEVAIFLFANSTGLLVPFTRDKNILESRISNLDRSIELGLGSNISQAINNAAQYLNKGGTIIVLSDGEQYSNDITLKVSKNIKVALVGMASLEGGKIPIRNEKGVIVDYLKFQGKTVNSRLDLNFINNLNIKYWPFYEKNLLTKVDSYIKRSKNFIILRNVINKNFLITGMLLLILSIIFKLKRSFTAISIILIILFSNGKIMAHEGLMNSLRSKTYTLRDKINLANYFLKNKKINQAHILFNEIGIKNMTSLDDLLNYATVNLMKGEIKKGINAFEFARKKHKVDYLKHDNDIKNNILLAIKEYEQSAKQIIIHKKTEKINKSSLFQQTISQDERLQKDFISFGLIPINKGKINKRNW